MTHRRPYRDACWGPRQVELIVMQILHHGVVESEFATGESNHIPDIRAVALSDAGIRVRLLMEDRDPTEEYLRESLAQ